MVALLRDQNVWKTQNVVGQTVFFGNEHLHSPCTWKQTAKPAMYFFVEYCLKHYNEKPRCAVCGCFLGGPGEGHLQSRNHFKRLKQFLGLRLISSTDRSDYWQVVRHSSGAARINHIDLEIQCCVGQPPPYKNAKLPCFIHAFREPACVLKTYKGTRAQVSTSSANSDIVKCQVVGLPKDQHTRGEYMHIAALNLEAGTLLAQRKKNDIVTVHNSSCGEDDRTYG